VTRPPKSLENLTGTRSAEFFGFSELTGVSKIREALIFRQEGRRLIFEERHKPVFLS
jgi:hypothetical protein